MTDDMLSKKRMEKELDDAIISGNTDLAEKLLDALYEETEEYAISMPADFPQEVMLRVQKERTGKMNKKKAKKRLIASVAAFALVLSFGITAYAQGWIQNAVSVLENKNAIVTGENINEENFDTALAQQDERMKDVYGTAETNRYPDFVTACESIGLPAVFPDYLTQHPEYATENGVYTSTSSENPNVKGVYSDFFAEGANKGGISMSLESRENTDEVIAAFGNNMKVQNTRTFTTTAGDTFTLYDLHYAEYEGEFLVEANISINNYLFNMMFSKVDAAAIEEALNSVDLTPLKE